MENFRREWHVRGKWLYNLTPGIFLGVRVVRAKSKNVRDRLNGEAASKSRAFDVELETWAELGSRKTNWLGGLRRTSLTGCQSSRAEGGCASDVRVSGVT
jgi:hypothetical protein